MWNSTITSGFQNLESELLEHCKLRLTGFVFVSGVFLTHLQFFSDSQIYLILKNSPLVKEILLFVFRNLLFSPPFVL